MKFLLDNWLLVALALTSGGLLIWPALLRGAQGQALSTQEAVQLINREKAVVVDVCEAPEYAAGHIAGARSVPLAELPQRLAETVKNKALPLILVCASGTRAQRARTEAQKLGYDKAYVLAGGLAAWKAANLPVEKG